MNSISQAVEGGQFPDLFRVAVMKEATGSGSARHALVNFATPGPMPGSTGWHLHGTIFKSILGDNRCQGCHYGGEGGHIGVVVLLRTVILNILPFQTAWSRLTQQATASISFLLDSLELKLLECCVKFGQGRHTVESPKRSVFLNVLPGTPKI